MRPTIYLVASLAAAGIAYYLASPSGSTPLTETRMAESADSGTGLAATPVTSQVMVDSGLLVLRVEDMHCEYACYPKVRETLEGLDQVVSVELDDQAEEGTLDNPQVLITYDPGFDLGAARSALAQRGFAKSSVVP
jgi:copper chaperone CopZ